MLACIGFCLVLACSGCILPGPGQRGILLGKRSWEPEGVARAEDPAPTEKDLSQRGASFPVEVELEPGGKVVYPDPTVDEVAGAEEADCRASDPQPNCTTPTMSEPGRHYPVCSALAALAGPVGAKIDARRYRPPRFHPVPLQPVFSSRLGEAPVVGFGAVSADGQLPAIPPEASGPQIEIILPSPPPKEIFPPQAEAEDEDRVTRYSRPLKTASRSGSWIFNPTLDRRPPGGPIPVKRRSVTD
jgi:hypothetical protein